jgi:hypothetical protein
MCLPGVPLCDPLNQIRSRAASAPTVSRPPVPTTWGGERSGVLTTTSAPGIVGAAAGARIPVLLDRSGQPVAPPVSRVAMVLNALVKGAAAAGGAGVALLIRYVLCRLALD